MAQKLTSFEKRRQRVRTAIRTRASQRPRLSIHRSGRHIYAQIIDDAAGKTVAAASTVEKEARAKSGANLDAAALVGKAVAERAKKAGVTKVVFDRGVVGGQQPRATQGNPALPLRLERRGAGQVALGQAVALGIERRDGRPGRVQSRRGRDDLAT